MKKKGNYKNFNYLINSQPGVKRHLVSSMACSRHSLSVPGRAFDIARQPPPLCFLDALDRLLKLEDLERDLDFALDPLLFDILFFIRNMLVLLPLPFPLTLRVALRLLPPPG